MDRKTLNRYLDVYDAAQKDEKYMQLYQGYRMAYYRFTEFLEDLSEPQQEIVFEFITCCGDLHHRLMEIACEKIQ